MNPSCSADIYTTNNSSTIDSYVGLSDIEDKQKEDKVDIIIGETTKLQCISNVIILRDIIINTIEDPHPYFPEGETPSVAALQAARGYLPSRQTGLAPEALGAGPIMPPKGVASSALESPIGRLWAGACA